MESFDTTAGNPPRWWNLRGADMRLDETFPYGVRIANGHIAEMIIEPPVCPGNPYRIHWNLCHMRRTPENKVSYGHLKGRMETSRHVLEAMFGLLLDGDYVEGFPQCDIVLWDIGSAAHGIFVRNGKWLNLPSVGTGRSGDPNLSTLLTSAMQMAVSKLIDAAELPRT